MPARSVFPCSTMGGPASGAVNQSSNLELSSMSIRLSLAEGRNQQCRTVPNRLVRCRIGYGRTKSGDAINVTSLHSVGRPALYLSYYSFNLDLFHRHQNVSTLKKQLTMQNSSDSGRWAHNRLWEGQERGCMPPEVGAVKLQPRIEPRFCHVDITTFLLAFIGSNEQCSSAAGESKFSCRGKRGCHPILL